MNPYYQSLLKDVISLFSKGEYEKVDSIIRQELSMPYVPQDAMSILEHYEQECRPHLSRYSRASVQDIEELTKGNTAQKEIAVNLLKASNLRQHHSDVQRLLDAEDLLQEFKGELIEALMEQKVSEPYRISKHGKTETFVPSSIIESENDPVLKEAREYLDAWLSFQNPLLLDFCLEMLNQEVLEMRPADFSGKNPKELAASLVRLVCGAMKDEEGWKALEDEFDLEGSGSYPLLIKERGEC